MTKLTSLERAQTYFVALSFLIHSLGVVVKYLNVEDENTLLATHFFSLFSFGFYAWFLASYYFQRWLGTPILELFSLVNGLCLVLIVITFTSNVGQRSVLYLTPLQCVEWIWVLLLLVSTVQACGSALILVNGWLSYRVTRDEPQPHEHMV